MSGLSALKTGIKQFISGPAKTQRHQVRTGSQVLAQWAAVLGRAKDPASRDAHRYRDYAPKRLSACAVGILPPGGAVVRRATDGKEAQALGAPLAYRAVGGVVESEREASAFGFSSAPVAAATARGWQSCRHEAARAASEADPAAGGAGAGADARPSARAPPPGSAAHVGVQVSGVPDRGPRGNGGGEGRARLAVT